MSVYVDSNIFILAVLDSGGRGQGARKFLSDAARKKETIITSPLTFDEVVWVIARETKDRDVAIAEGRNMLQLSILRIVETDKPIIHHALQLMQKYEKIAPRDAIHLATAVRAGAHTIISDDSDFDDLKEVKRRPL